MITKRHKVLFFFGAVFCTVSEVIINLRLLSILVKVYSWDFLFQEVLFQARMYLVEPYWHICICCMLTGADSWYLVAELPRVCLLPRRDPEQVVWVRNQIGSAMKAAVETSSSIAGWRGSPWRKSPSGKDMAVFTHRTNDNSQRTYSNSRCVYI